MKVGSIDRQNLINVNQNKSKVETRTSFGDILKGSLNKVNNLQHTANKAGEDLALGRVDNIHEVMIASQKAKLSLDLTTSVTRKAVDAYKEIMRMQV